LLAGFNTGPFGGFSSFFRRHNEDMHRRIEQEGHEEQKIDTARPQKAAEAQAIQVK
jgi:hypothetical protein